MPYPHIGMHLEQNIMMCKHSVILSSSGIYQDAIVAFYGQMQLVSGKHD